MNAKMHSKLQVNGNAIPGKLFPVMRKQCKLQCPMWQWLLNLILSFVLLLVLLLLLVTFTLVSWSWNLFIFINFTPNPIAKKEKKKGNPPSFMHASVITQAKSSPAKPGFKVPVVQLQSNFKRQDMFNFKSPLPLAASRRGARPGRAEPGAAKPEARPAQLRPQLSKSCQHQLSHEAPHPFRTLTPLLE